MAAVARKPKSQKVIVAPPEAWSDDTPAATETFVVYRKKKPKDWERALQFMPKGFLEREDRVAPAFKRAVEVIGEAEFEAGLPEMVLSRLIQDRFGLQEYPWIFVFASRTIDYVFRDVAAAVALWPTIGGGKKIGPRVLSRMIGRDEDDVEACLEVLEKYGNLQK